MFKMKELLLFAVRVAMKQRAAEREHLRKEREEKKRKLEQEKLVLPFTFSFLLSLHVTLC